MLKRCYAPKALGDRKKRVRFLETNVRRKNLGRETLVDEDLVSVKSSRSEKVHSRALFSWRSYQSHSPSAVTPTNHSKTNVSGDFSDRLLHHSSCLQLTISHDTNENSLVNPGKKLDSAALEESTDDIFISDNLLTSKKLAKRPPATKRKIS
jgi:hypothetical protein